MTRKDYIKIAKILRDHRKRYYDALSICNEDNHLTAYQFVDSYNFDTLIYNFCEMLKVDNEDFDNQKFIDAITNHN
jgi:hypothetical protein